MPLKRWSGLRLARVVGVLLAHAVAADAAEVARVGRDRMRMLRHLLVVGAVAHHALRRRPVVLRLRRRGEAEQGEQADNSALLIPIRTPITNSSRTSRRARLFRYLCTTSTPSGRPAAWQSTQLSCVWNDCACVAVPNAGAADPDHVVDRLLGVVARRAGRGLRRDHDPVERVRAGLQRRRVDRLRHHRTERAAVALPGVVDVAAVAVQAHGRIGDLGGVVLHVGARGPELVPAGTTTPVENGWNSVPAGAETLVDVLAGDQAVQRQQDAGLVERADHVVAVRERILALRVAVDAVDHALERVVLAQRPAVGHHGATSSGSGRGRARRPRTVLRAPPWKALASVFEPDVVPSAPWQTLHLSLETTSRRGLQRAAEREVREGVLHDDVDVLGRRHRRPRVGVVHATSQLRLLDLADADDARRARRRRPSAVSAGSGMSTV